MAEKGKLERRLAEGARILRAEEDPKLEGYAAVFNEWADIGGWFRERIAPGAFAECLAGGPDVRALFNHDVNHVLGRTVSGTLALEEDDHGLKVVIDPPDTSLGRDLRALVERGDVTQMSFGFYVLKDVWETDHEEGRDARTVLKADIFDVSIVTFPAYEGTSVALRDGARAVYDARRDKLKKQRERRSRRLALRLELAKLRRR